MDEPVFESEADGLAASEVRMSPYSALELAVSRHGVYLLVLGGELTVDHVTFDPWSVLYYGAGEALPELNARAAGAQLLHLRFPHPRSPAD